MIRILTALLLLLSITSVHAAVGDTTIINSHNKTRLTSFGKFDKNTLFPDSLHSFNRIMMEFELGKYPCIGYDPNQVGNTGFCADWDYPVQIIVCTPSGDTVEMGRIVTPYANNRLPRTPADWSHKYWIDVTEYYSLLRNNVTIRLFHSGEHGGFTGTVNFHMIEGPRNRDVISLVPLWLGEFRYGDSTNTINQQITPKDLLYPLNAKYADYKMFVSGHGGTNEQECGEFCKKWYLFKINNLDYDMNYIWRDDCSDNFLYPQSGLWLHDRANWCPGNLVEAYHHQIHDRVNPGDSFLMSLSFENFVSPRYHHQYANYLLGGAAIFYSDYNVNKDVSIEAIIAPNADPTYYRFNPACFGPSIRVKNRGKEDITSLYIRFGLGVASHRYTFNGLIKSEEEMIIDLPNFIMNSSTNFIVQIDSVNNAVDENPYNNKLNSVVPSVPIIEYGTLLIESMNIGDVENVLRYSIKDQNNNIIFLQETRNPAQVNTNYIGLPNGCYELEVTTSAKKGLHYFNQIVPGYFNLYNVYNNDTVAVQIPKHNFADSELSLNFGVGFKQQFIVTNSQALSVTPILNNQIITLYPNPAQQTFTLSHEFDTNSNATVTIYDALGRKVKSYIGVVNNQSFTTEDLPDGIYVLHYKIDHNLKIMKLQIVK